MLRLSERRSVSEELNGYTSSSEYIHTRQLQLGCLPQSCTKNRLDNIQAPGISILPIHITISGLGSYLLNFIPQGIQCRVGYTRIIESRCRYRVSAQGIICVYPWLERDKVKNCATITSFILCITFSPSGMIPCPNPSVRRIPRDSTASGKVPVTCGSQIIAGVKSLSWLKISRAGLLDRDAVEVVERSFGSDTDASETL